MNDLSEKIIGRYERHAANWDADRRAGGWKRAMFPVFAAHAHFRAIDQVTEDREAGGRTVWLAQAVAIGK